jgi:hypothetical protein
VGTTRTASVTLTASRAITVSSVTTGAPFGIGAALSLPASLARGASLTVPVQFSPTAPGQFDGTLTVKTADGETDLIGVHGVGTKDGLGATPGTIVFTDVPTQTTSRQTVNVVNTGTTAVTITGVTLPADAQLTVDAASVPVVGQQLQPLTSIPVPLTFAPTTTTPVTDSLVVTSDRGSVTVPVTATAVSGTAHLQVPSSLDFGDVPVGTSVTRDFQIQNTGNVPMTVTKAKAPEGVFSTTSPVSEGLVIPAGDSAYQTVTFTPAAAGQAGTPDTYYLVTANDGQGAFKVMLTGNGVNDPIAVHAGEVGAGRYTSPIGQALSPEYDIAGGRCQDYTHGVICWSLATGVHEVHGVIYDRYKAAGGPAGFLGFPTTDQKAAPDGLGKYNHFSGSGGASIYWSAATGAHEVRGAIRTEWAALGWEKGLLGYPTTDQKATPDRVGRYNHFSGSGGSSIYWSASTGAHEVHGGIRTEWAALGWEKGLLGYPTTDQKATPDRIGRYNHFSGSGGASIYWSSSTGAHEVHGAIRTRWAALGWEKGRLGYPISDEYAVTGGLASNFRGGRLVWNARTGVVTG